MAVKKPRKKAEPIRKTTGKGGNYRPFTNGRRAAATATQQPTGRQGTEKTGVDTERAAVLDGLLWQASAGRYRH